MNLKFKYVMICVADVQESVDFYEKAFGLKLAYMAEGSVFAMMETGSTFLCFSANKLVEGLLPIPYAKNEIAQAPAGILIAFETEDLQAAYDRALVAGAKPLVEPTEQPWGQKTAHVRDLNGVIVELCTPLSS